MLYPLIWPTVALHLASLEEFPWGWDVHSVQGNKAPAGHSHSVGAGCPGPSSCCWQTEPTCLSFCTSQQSFQTCHPAHTGRNKVPEHRSTLSNAAGGESKKVFSGGFNLDETCGLEGEVLISTFCTLALTTKVAPTSQAGRTGFVLCTTKKYVPSPNGSKI